MTNGPPLIFDRAAYRARRARAMRRTKGAPTFLAETTAASLCHRIGAVNRRFAAGLDLSARPELRTARQGLAQSWTDAPADEESLPFAPESFDLAVSVLSLHAANDLPGALIQIRKALKPDGLFMAALFGGATLTELRQSLTAAEAKIWGGAAARVSPFGDVRDLGGLLQRAGFALPVADVERTMVRYGKLATLFSDLRDLGETNVLSGRPRFLRRDVLAAMAQEYGARFSDSDGRIRATFDIVFLTGWAPHESQQKPLKPGSAKARLADALGTKEIPAGEKPSR